MAVLSRLGTALFAVPLFLSSVLLKALGATGKKPKRRCRGRAHAARTATVADAAAAPPAVAVPRRGHRSDVRAMQRELASVLDAHRGSRDVFRYLSHFERRFAKNGLATLDAMPVERLRRALAQFEAIVSNWSSASLANLRSRMAVAVSLRDQSGTVWRPAETLSKTYTPRAMPMLAANGNGTADFRADRQVEVDDDVSISRFEAAFGAWHPSQQQQPLTAAGVI